MNHAFSTSQLICSISCSLRCTLPNEAETTWSDKTKMHHDSQSSSQIYSRCSIGKVSLTHHTVLLQNEWTAGSKSCRQTEPIQVSLPPRSRPVSGRALVPEQQMVVKWWPIITHPTEKMAVLCRKRRVGILLFAGLKFFLRNVSMSKYCFVTAEVLHNLVWGCTSGSVLQKLPPLSLKIGRV